MNGQSLVVGGCSMVICGIALIFLGPLLVILVFGGLGALLTTPGGLLLTVLALAVLARWAWRRAGELP